ncbi:N-acetylglucosamine kinase [Companilactobacillus zhachilii]|uniref:N-acetylglucosamine kinase n=1 Tax=Companilactobacillus zhachilii TaxID=2304606 RepID=A0A386PSB3_9LACO|nr:BadF/BadG/BcrA/BcrD ATPase family protein [Companilactobacillus zhachilii]AYE37260.1 N-acetylglucosamine kinase [Companilactobacillus zhachilii]
MSYVIGLDCGGTHIVGQLWNKDSRELITEVKSGPGNVVMNYALAISNIVNTIQEILDKNNTIQIELILVGIAGIESSSKTNEVISLLTNTFNVHVEVISDAKLALLNGLEGRDGSLIISGTGSIIYGRQNNTFLRVGGLGYILGDEGSAYDISKRALQQVLNRIDANKKSLLQASLFSGLNAHTKNEAIAQFYTNDRKENANLARIVAKEAENKNLDAIDVLDSCSKSLANQAITMLSQFEKPIPNTIALSGSVLKNNELFNKKLRMYISNKFPECEFVNITSNNAHGVLFFDNWKQSN